MKKYSYLAVVFFIASFAVSASAKMLALGEAMRGLPVLTSQFITPEGKEVGIGELRLFAGTSTTVPCTDLTVVEDIQAGGDDTITAESGTEALTSEDLAEVFGANKTCIKVDAIMKGKVYSTGNIKLTWDTTVNAYVKADPAFAVIDFTH